MQKTPYDNKKSLPCMTNHYLINCSWNPYNTTAYNGYNRTKTCDHSPEPGFIYTCYTITYKPYETLCYSNQRHTYCIAECLRYQLFSKHVYLFSFKRQIKNNCRFHAVHVYYHKIQKEIHHCYCAKKTKPLV